MKVYVLVRNDIFSQYEPYETEYVGAYKTKAKAKSAMRKIIKENWSEELNPGGIDKSFSSGMVFCAGWEIDLYIVRLELED